MVTLPVVSYTIRAYPLNIERIASNRTTAYDYWIRILDISLQITRLGVFKTSVEGLFFARVEFFPSFLLERIQVMGRSESGILNIGCNLSLQFLLVDSVGINEHLDVLGEQEIKDQGSEWV